MFNTNKRTKEQVPNKVAVTSDFKDTFVPDVLSKCVLTMTIKEDTRYLKCLVKNPSLVGTEPIHDNLIKQDYSVIHESIADTKSAPLSILKVSGYKQVESEDVGVEII